MMAVGRDARVLCLSITSSGDPGRHWILKLFRTTTSAGKRVSQAFIIKRHWFWVELYSVVWVQFGKPGSCKNVQARIATGWLNALFGWKSVPIQYVLLSTFYSEDLYLGRVRLWWHKLSPQDDLLSQEQHSPNPPHTRRAGGSKPAPPQNMYTCSVKDQSVKPSTRPVPSPKECCLSF